jgi:hypothetical protein
MDSLSLLTLSDGSTATRKLSIGPARQDADNLALLLHIKDIGRKY